MRTAVYSSLKMQSFRRHRQGFLSRAAVPAIVLGALLLVAVVVRVAAPDTFSALLSPLYQVGTAASEALTFSESVDTLRAERNALLSENRTLQNENAALRARLATTDGVSSDSTIAAGVLARPPLSPYDVLLIAAGRVQGVTEGALVYAEGVPIGVIAEVAQHSARVVLYTSAGYETEGWVGEERLPLLVRGKGAGAFESDVARDAAVHEGDSVYLPGPGALPIGTVAKVESHSSSPRASIFIRPLVNPFSLSWVSVHIDTP